MDPITIAAFMAILSFMGTAISAENQAGEANRTRHFNSDEAEKSREWEFSPERYNQAIDLGFNPDIVAASMLGGQGAANYAASSPISSVPNMGSVLSSMLGSAGSSVSDLFNTSDKNEGIKLDNAIKQIESSFLPLSYEKQFELWDGQIARDVAAANLSDTEAEYMRGKIEWLPSLSQSECLKNMGDAERAFADAELAYAKADTEGTLQDLYKAQTENVEADTELTRAKTITEGYVANVQKELRRLYHYEADQEYIARRLAFYDAYLRDKIGIPLPEDTKELLWVMRGVPELAGRAENLENAFYRGMRRQYDEQVMEAWKNYPRTFAMDLGQSVNNAIPAIAPAYVFKKVPGASSSKPKGSAGISRSKKGTKYGVGYSYGRPKGRYYTGFQMRDGSYTWETTE